MTDRDKKADPLAWQLRMELRALSAACLSEMEHRYSLNDVHIVDDIDRQIRNFRWTFGQTDMPETWRRQGDLQIIRQDIENFRGKYPEIVEKLLGTLSRLEAIYG